MIVDASAALAIILAESDADHFSAAISSAPDLRMSAANWLEAAIRIDGIARGAPVDVLEDFVTQSRIQIAPVTAEQARLARRAYRAYGKGSGHPARLNFGDCFAYALAKSSGEPLLCKGDEFRRTDVAVV